MFNSLGRFVIRFKWPIVLVWAAAAVWMATMAPSLADYSVSETSDLLPRNAPSIIAQTKLAEAFPDEANLGTAIAVFERAGGLTSADNSYARSFVDWLSSDARPGEVDDVTSIFNQQGTESLLLSADKSTMLVQIAFSTGPMDDETRKAIATIRQWIKDTPPPDGLAVHLTGSAALSGDQRVAMFEGLDRTTIATVVLVVLVLLLIYRSPVAALAPLITITVAWVVSRGVLGYLAAAGWKVSSYVDTFIIVLIFGVGTDYCLFILSRFREELGRQSTRDRAIEVTMRAIGSVITASAATVIIALALMAIGQFVMLQTMGPAMALAVFVTLIAGLTLTPALVAIVGHYLFWPRHDEVTTSGKTWRRIAEIATTRSGLVSAVVVAVLLIPYLALPQMNRTFDVLSEMPDTVDSVQGFESLTRGFEAGEMLPVTILLSAPQGKVLDDLSKIDAFSQAVAASPDVSGVRTILQPTADPAASQMFRVDAQVKQAAAALDTLIQGLNDPAGMMGGQSGAQQGGGLSDLTDYLGQLGSVPAVAALPSYTEAVARAKAVEAGIANLTEAGKLPNQLAMLSEQMTQLAATLKAATANPQAAGSSAGAAGDLSTLASYLTQMGQAQPLLAREPSYQDALIALKTLGDDLTAVQQALLVTNQLGLLAEQVQQLSKTLSTPLGLLSLTGASSQQLTMFAGYVTELGKAYPSIAGHASYQSILARLTRLEAAAKQMQASVPTDLNAAVAQLKKEVDGIGEDTLALRQFVATQQPNAQFMPQNLATLMTAAGATTTLPDPSASAQRLANDLAALTAFAKANLPTATFMPRNIPLSEAVTRALAALKQEAAGLQSALNRLSADTAAASIPFLPTSLLKDSRAAGLMNYYVSADGASTRVTVVLKARPYSPQANAAVQKLEPVVTETGKRLGLETAMGGVPSIMSDVQTIINRDFVRIGLLTIVGVFVVLIVLLRSLVAPIYLVLTVLLSYGTTLGLSTFVFQDLLGHDGINMVIPIVVFVLLVALGADYNIFLVSRVREEAEGRGTHEGIRVASAYTGAIITSCGIILAGTFAALMFAPLRIFLQVGFAVAVGVLVDTFVIRAVLVPAIAAIFGEKNWWPGRLKTSV